MANEVNAVHGHVTSFKPSINLPERDTKHYYAIDQFEKEKHLFLLTLDASTSLCFPSLHCYFIHKDWRWIALHLNPVLTFFFCFSSFEKIEKQTVNGIKSISERHKKKGNYHSAI